MSEQPEILERDIQESQVQDDQDVAVEEEPAVQDAPAESLEQTDREAQVSLEEPPEAGPAEDQKDLLEDLLQDSAAAIEETPEEQQERHWYVIHSYSGYENKVKKNLESRIESMGMQDYIFEVVVPTEEVLELKDGRRRTVEQRIFPGYILVDMILTDESWFVVRNTPGVTGFVGSGNQPTPLRQEEADAILKRMEEEAPKVKVSFRIGDSVRIVDGPFTDFMGTVDDLNLEKGKVRLLVSFFGRETPVELDFLQVEST
jgi:transcriptional antiterminator NusG